MRIAIPRRSSARSGMAAVATVLVLGVLITVMAFRAHGQSTPPPGVERYHSVKVALEARLSEQYLSYQWVVCTRMPQRFHVVQVSRCNVNFGDPHIVPYCAVLIAGILVTDQDNHAVDCGARAKGDEQG